MPAEAIHLSALEDSLAGAGTVTRGALGSDALRQAARAGALFVDLAYFDGLWRSVARHVLRLQPVLSGWGEALHRNAPIALLRGLVERGVALRRARGTQDAGAWLVALGLGYASHAAVDRALHPLVNRLAGARAAAAGDTLVRQHQEVEKFQSLLFHQDRFGFDPMGTDDLRAYLRVEAAPLGRRGPIARAVQDAFGEALGRAPGRGAMARWVRGYGAYVELLAGRWGRRVSPVPSRERERAALYTEVRFPERYAAAVAQSARAMENLAAYAEDGAFDASARAALETVLPEGTLDPEAEPSP